MERHKAPKILDESSTLSEIRSFKKNWRNAFRVAGLLTLGAVGYVTTEVVTENFSLNQTSDALILLFGIYSALISVRAPRALDFASSMENRQILRDRL